MHNLIYQVYVGNQSKLYDTCVDSVSKYCKRYGISHVIQRHPLLKIRPDPNTSGRSREAVERLGYLPIYEKENAFTYFDDYDNVAIVDADIYIKDTAPNIFAEIQDYEFAAVVERQMPLTEKYFNKIRNYSRMQYGNLQDVDWKWNENGAEFMNMGLMVMSCKMKKYLHGQTPEQFIKRKEFKRFVDGQGAWKWSTDQTLLNYWLKKENVYVKHLDWRWNALYGGIEDKYLDEAHFIHYFLDGRVPNNESN